MAKRPKAELVLAKAKERGVEVRLSDPRVQRLAARFLEIRGQSFRYLVDVARETGDLLHEARALLPDPRVFNRFTDSLDVSRGSAKNFENVAALARHQPAVYEKWKGLGPAKIYRLARMKPEARAKVLAISHVDRMTDAGFAVLCSAFPSGGVEVTGNMLGNGLVQKALGMGRKMQEWEIPAITSDEIRKNLKRGLLDLARLARGLAKQL